MTPGDTPAPVPDPSTQIPIGRQRIKKWQPTTSEYATYMARIGTNFFYTIAAIRATSETYERMLHPQVGDLVCELSTMGDDSWPLRAVGKLHAVEDELNFDGEEPTTSRFYYVDRLDGAGRVRWPSHANLITIVPKEDIE